MSEKRKGQNYQRALELVKRGDNKQALECLAEHLKSNPEDSEAMNDIGAVCYCMGKTDLAIEYLEKARRLDPDSGEICWNLVEAYLAANMPEFAVGQFEDIERFGLSNFDLYNRAARLFVDKNHKALAIDMLLKSLQIAPNQDLLYPMIEVLKGKRPRIVFFCWDKKAVSSMKDIMDFVAKRFSIKFFHSLGSQQLAQTLNATDIAWFENITPMLVNATGKKSSVKVIVRLSRKDIGSQLIDQVKWENVDKIFIPAEKQIKNKILNELPMIEMQTSVIFFEQGVNLEKYKLRNHVQGKNLICIDDLKSENNPILLIQCMQKLNYIDKDYKLFFAGDCEDADLEKYLRFMVNKLGLDGTVIFDSCNLELSELLENKHYIVSASISNSQTENIFKSMASGLKPVIHSCPDVYDLFEDKYLFNITEDFCDRVISKDYNPCEYRDFVNQWYSQANQLFNINKILTDFEKEIEKTINFSNKEIDNLAESLKNNIRVNSKNPTPVN